MTEHPLAIFLLLPLAAYVVGSTPCGVLIARSRRIDLRSVGSGNVGATNVARAMGRKWGYFCFLLDVTKGLAPTLLMGFLLRLSARMPTLMEQAAWLAVGFGAIAGHVFSFYLRFRGGKGVATALGVVLGVFPYFTWPGLCSLGVWVVVALASRYVSLASIAAALCFVPLFLAFRWSEAAGLWPLLVFALAMVALIVFRHRTNISRLLAGKESKIGQGGKDQS